MMKLILSILLALPVSAFGAFNDASLDVGTVLSVGGVNYTVYASTALLESITVNASSFDVTMAAGSTLTIYSGTNQTFTVTTNPLITVTSSCAGAYSTLALTASGSVTVTVTPSGACSYNTGGGGTSYSDPVPPPPPPPPAPVATTTATSSSILVATTTDILVKGPLLTKTLQLGSTDAEVILLQQFLIARGILLVPATMPLGYFGALTHSAVIKFQESIGLDPVGICGSQTRAAIASSTVSISSSMTSLPLKFRFTRPLKIGMNGADVAAMQQILIAKGFLEFNPRSTPGYFGGTSRVAVMLFQKSLGLEQVGVVGPRTRAELNKITGAF